jgi:hypothetical protein
MDLRQPLGDLVDGVEKARRIDQRCHLVP